MRNLQVVRWSALIGIFCLCAQAGAQIKLPRVISSHMVLQQGMQDPVWGTAAPKEKVTVKFRDQEKTTEADQDGKWALKLDSLKAGGPDKLVINGSNSITIEDVLVGDVWVGSGQSNMAMNASSYVEKDPVLAKNIDAAPYPKLRLISPSGGWQEATPATMKNFSALLLSFGLPLQKEIDVPVGLMVGAVGGTPSGAWLSQEAFDADAACHEQAQKAMADYKPQEDQKKYDAALAAYEKAAAEAKTSGAKAPRKPDAPVKPGEMTNGQKFGYLYAKNIQPYVPFAIHGVLWDQGEAGTAVRDIDQYTLMGALIRGWRKEWGQGEFPFLYVQKPSGGGCALDPHNPINSAAEPFVPLTPESPVNGDGKYREIHIKIRQYPDTFLVTATDLGKNTHPINKSGYGARASLVALGGVYGRKLEIYGPVYESFKVEGDKIRVSFSHIGQGLVFPAEQKLQGFIVAGDDKKFYWADAVIDGDAVVVHSEKVPNPVAVRYAWSQSHPWANLFNKDGLPAVTFRSDSW